MSNLEGLPKDLTPDHRDNYEQGVLGFHPELVSEILRLDASNASVRGNTFRAPERTEAYRALLSEMMLEEFYPNLLLATILTSIRGPDELRVWGLASLIDPLIQAMYDEGFNDFEVDLTHFSTRATRLGLNLEGAPDRLLRLDISGRVHTIAQNCTHVNMRIHDDVDYAGIDIEHTELIFHGQVHNNTFRAVDCRYEFFKDIPVVMQTYNGGRIMDAVGGEWYCSQRFSDCQFYAHLWNPQKPPKILGHEFTSKGNSFFVPDGDGGWKEVTP